MKVARFFLFFLLSSFVFAQTNDTTPTASNSVPVDSTITDANALSSSTSSSTSSSSTSSTYTSSTSSIDTSGSPSTNTSGSPSTDTSGTSSGTSSSTSSSTSPTSGASTNSTTITPSTTPMEGPSDIIIRAAISSQQLNSSSAIPQIISALNKNGDNISALLLTYYDVGEAHTPTMGIRIADTDPTYSAAYIYLAMKDLFSRQTQLNFTMTIDDTQYIGHAVVTFRVQSAVNNSRVIINAIANVVLASPRRFYVHTPLVTLKRAEQPAVSVYVLNNVNSFAPSEALAINVMNTMNGHSFPEYEANNLPVVYGSANNKNFPDDGTGAEISTTTTTTTTNSSTSSPAVSGDDSSSDTGYRINLAAAILIPIIVAVIIIVGIVGYLVTRKKRSQPDSFARWQDDEDKDVIPLEDH
ncbi:hypothetical protein PROFUN_13964 [Planoprotostelium fungivorum]|uniref:Uncharacterized protein n=1 Tax=Planoprotostelium fungivorum TaxID=1890364 RepID=A0A2P6N2P5_9EUKA|nr:hypothetical protein PROFUN_13964 [Planoprotostelium fungivorum]